MERLKVGVIGCGMVAQVMHLHYLRELAEQFEIAALCDISAAAREACARDYSVARRFDDWHALLEVDIDAVLVLTSGSHAPIAIAAAKAGKHVLVEKPLCFSVMEGKAIIAAAERAGVVLMVAYNKRYDPAYCWLQNAAKELRHLRLVRITTLESPLQPYVAQYRLHAGGHVPAELADAMAADDAARVTAAIGDADALSRRAYQVVLLDSMVHEFNAVRGVLGEPDRLDFAAIGEHGLNAVLRFGETPCTLAWVDLPGIARYQMEFCFFTPDRRLTLSFPSPFLRSMPTLLINEGGDVRSAHSVRSEEVVSYEESFKNELIHFYNCITAGMPPITSGADALRDVALCQAVVAAHRERRGIDQPTATD